MRHLLIALFLLTFFLPAQAQIACPFAVVRPDSVKTYRDFLDHREIPPQLLVRGKTATAEAAESHILDFMQRHLRRPDQGDVNGTVVVSFVIGSDGLIDPASVRCVRDIGGGYGPESERLARLLATLGWRWVPGRFRGEPVPVRYNFPLRI